MGRLEEFLVREDNWYGEDCKVILWCKLCSNSIEFGAEIDLIDLINAATKHVCYYSVKKVHPPDVPFKHFYNKIQFTDNSIKIPKLRVTPTDSPLGLYKTLPGEVAPHSTL